MFPHLQTAVNRSLLRTCELNWFVLNIFCNVIILNIYFIYSTTSVRHIARYPKHEYHIRMDAVEGRKRPDQGVLDRFKRLNNGMWIRGRPGRTTQVCARASGCFCGRFGVFSFLLFLPFWVLLWGICDIFHIVINNLRIIIIIALYATR
jgi:hypothetical protein